MPFVFSFLTFKDITFVMRLYFPFRLAKVGNTGTHAKFLFVYTPTARKSTDPKFPSSFKNYLQKPLLYQLAPSSDQCSGPPTKRSNTLYLTGFQ